MKLLLYLILFLIPTTIMHSMELDLTDEDSEGPDEQQENNLKELAKAAAKKKLQRHQQIQELTEEEKEFLNIDGANEADYAELVKRIKKRESLRKRTQTHQSQKADSIKEIFLTSNNSQDMIETSLVIPPQHFAVCFYLQVLQHIWKEGQYVETIRRQHALLIICPNLFLTVKNGEYDFLNSANPYSNQIKDFITTRKGDAIEKYAMMLIATNLNHNYCKESEKRFASDQFYSKFYYYDLKNIAPETKKTVLLKFHKNISEYASFCSIHNDKKPYYVQSLSATPEFLVSLNKKITAQVDLKK